MHYWQNVYRFNLIEAGSIYLYCSGAVDILNKLHRMYNEIVTDHQKLKLIAFIYELGI